MCLLYIVILAYLGASALAIWLLPPWLSYPLVGAVGIALCVVIWKILGFIKKLKQAVGGLLPQEKLRSLAAGETFTGHGFSFTFPMACEVSQTHFREIEALILKPKLDFPGAPKETLLVVSTLPPGELKPKINEVIEKIFAQVEGKAGEPEPVEAGPYRGDRRAFSTTKDGKDVRGEAVFLGDDKGSIAWVAIAEGGNFDVLAGKYRELAVLVQRVQPPAVPPISNTAAHL